MAQRQPTANEGDPHTTATRPPVYFDMMADMDLTKHLGGQIATDELLERCHIVPGDHVLDVGCGVGQTSVYLATRRRCHVTAFDLHRGIVARAQARLRRNRIADQVDLGVADVQALPYADCTFDAVIAESVLAFAENKLRAIRECARVVRPGHYVGFNEATWLRAPERDRMKELLTDYSGYGEFHTADQWRELLMDAGLEAVRADARPVRVGEELAGRIRRYGWRGLARVWWRFLTHTMFQPKYRALYKDALGISTDVLGLMGYGLYVGRKPR